MQGKDALGASREGKITEEGLAELQKRKGLKLRIPWMNNQLASKETIRNFAWGVGDGNPLWADEQYCANTRYQHLVAPPSWLYSVFGPGVQHGLRGVHSFHAGDDWTFYKPVLVGDTIRPEAIAMGYEEKPSKLAGRTIIDYQERRYYNQLNELVAKALKWSVRAERGAVEKRGKFRDVQLPHPWTEEELQRIDAQILSEQIRGGAARYWEDVTEGEEVGPLVKGPLGVTDQVAFAAGTHISATPAHEVALRQYREHPAWAVRDPVTHAWEPIAAVHWNSSVAAVSGLPYPYDVGMQRNSWLIQMLTDWMGDEGWLKRCYAEYRSFVFLSDVLWLSGKVTRKFTDDEGELCVEIESSALNQRGQNTMPGKAVIVLPSREKDAWPLGRRLPVPHRSEAEQET